ncbi:histidine N-acetyltransferase-like [Liolophura sinensis]|uniref:histidine N-acetyltransferase-like n=1 Tax=Liolophura sinensis TaxID=3198878 RepID=UPI003158261F
MAAELQCRRATLADREDVLNIITPFEGRDYLPSLYNHMIADPSFVGVLGELDGEVVAFAGAWVINDGTTMMTKGSRVKEGLQGKGVYARLWRYLCDTIRDSAPGLKYEEFTTNVHNPLLHRPASKRKYAELYRMPIRCYSLQRELIRKRTFPPSGRVQEMEVEDLRQILSDKQLSAVLFPRRLVIDWHVYLPIVENVDIIKAQGTYVTKTGDEGLRTTELITFGDWYQCEEYLAYSMDVFGKVDDTASLSEHFHMHAKKAMELHDGDVRFLIFIEPELLDVTDSACRLLHFLPSHFFTTHCVWLIREI